LKSSTTARLQRAVLSLVLVVLVGVAWYVFAEGFTLLEAVFMAVTTVTTVG
jgi:hypothetical protein